MVGPKFWGCASFRGIFKNSTPKAPTDVEWGSQARIQAKLGPISMAGVKAEIVCSALGLPVSFESSISLVARREITNMAKVRDIMKCLALSAIRRSHFAEQTCSSEPSVPFHSVAARKSLLSMTVGHDGHAGR